MLDAGTWPCPIRAIVIEAFQHHRPAMAAAFLGVVTYLTRTRRIAGCLAPVALSIAISGLILYDADVAAPVVLACVLLMPSSRQRTVD